VAPQGDAGPRLPTRSERMSCPSRPNMQSPVNTDSDSDEYEDADQDMSDKSVIAIDIDTDEEEYQDDGSVEDGDVTV
jgi:hypothetical protein